MSHVLRVGIADQIAYFRAYNTDGSAKTDLTSSTTGLTLSVFRIGASSVSIASLSNKAADDTAHADGAIRSVGGNLYTIDIPDAATATQVPSIVVRGSYTGGVIEGLEHPIVAYDPSLAYQQQLWAAANSTVNLSGTTIKTATDVEADTLDIQSRIPASLDNGLMRSSVQKSSSDVAGVVTNSETPTATMFSTNLDYYDTTFDRMIIRFTSGSLVGASHIIKSYVNADGKVTVAEPFALAPEVDDEFVILTDSQVHPVATITDAVWAKDISAATAGTAGAYLKDIWGRVTAAIYTMWTNLTAMITGTGANASFTEKALENIPASSVTITPLSSTVEQRVDGTNITVFLGENITIGPIVVTDSNGNAVDLSATCEIVISRKFRGDILVIPNSSITRSGAGNNQFTFPSTGATLITGTHAWALRRVSDNFVYAYGDWIVKQAATKD